MQQQPENQSKKYSVLFLDIDRTELKVDADDIAWRPFSVGDAYCKAVVCLLSSERPKRFNTDGEVILDNSWLKTSASKTTTTSFLRRF